MTRPARTTSLRRGFALAACGLSLTTLVGVGVAQPAEARSGWRLCGYTSPDGHESYYQALVKGSDAEKKGICTAILNTIAGRLHPEGWVRHRRLECQDWAKFSRGVDPCLDWKHVPWLNTADQAADTRIGYTYAP